MDFTGRVELKVARTLAKSGIPCRVGFNRGGRGVYHTVPLPFPDITVPMREVNLRLAQALGGDVKDTVPNLPTGTDRERRGLDAWASMKLKDPVALMPGAFYTAQRWPVSRFTEVGGALLRQNIDVAVICGPGEEELGERLSDSLDCPLVAAPSMTLLMDLLATSRAVVCNNTGTLHLAAALDVPTVSTMGPTVPWRFWPASHSESVVFRGGSNGPQGDLLRIDPLEVSTAVLHLLDES